MKEERKSFVFQAFDAAGKVRGKVAVIFFPQTGQFPVIACDFSTAGFRATMAFKLIIRAAVRHGVIEGQFIACFDAMYGDQADLPEESQVRFAGMIEAIVRFFFLGG